MTKYDVPCNLFKAANTYFCITMADCCDDDNACYRVIEDFNKVLRHFCVNNQSDLLHFDKHRNLLGKVQLPQNISKNIVLDNVIIKIINHGFLTEYQLELIKTPIGEISAFIHTVEPEVINHLVSSLCGYIWIHGACMVNNTELLFIVGASGIGKTTSSLALLSKGYQLITDDIILIDLINHQLIPFARCPKIRSGGAAEQGR